MLAQNRTMPAHVKEKFAKTWTSKKEASLTKKRYQHMRNPESG